MSIMPRQSKNETGTLGYQINNSPIRRQCTILCNQTDFDTYWHPAWIIRPKLGTYYHTIYFDCTGVKFFQSDDTAS